MKEQPKPFYKKVTVWLAVLGPLSVVTLVILNKVLNLNFSTAEMITAIGAVTSMVSVYVGAEKVKDAKVISGKLESDAAKYLTPAYQLFEVVAGKSEEGKKAIETVKEIIDQSEEVKKVFDEEVKESAANE